jgi:hypothetical protein
MRLKLDARLKASYADAAVAANVNKWNFGTTAFSST